MYQHCSLRHQLIINSARTGAIKTLTVLTVVLLVLQTLGEAMYEGPRIRHSQEYKSKQLIKLNIWNHRRFLSKYQFYLLRTSCKASFNQQKVSNTVRIEKYKHFRTNTIIKINRKPLRQELHKLFSNNQQTFCGISLMRLLNNWCKANGFQDSGYRAQKWKASSIAAVQRSGTHAGFCFGGG